MGRLIDADKLKEAIDKHKGTVNSTDLFKYCFDGGVDKSLSEIESAETVEAIPIDWIEKKMQWLREHNSAFYNPVYFLETMLVEWKEEQNEQTN